MEMGLNGLIDKIKKEGVEEAETKARDILKEAEKQAEKIMKDGDQEKEASVEAAKKEIRQFDELSKKALNQAARDVLLSLRGRVAEFAGRLVNEVVSKEMSHEVVKEMIIKVVSNFTKENDFSLEVLVNEKDRTSLEKAVLNDLKKTIKDKLAVKGSKTIDKGFRIGYEGKNSYLDFTDEAISEAFIKYLNPKLVEKLDIDLGIDKGKESGR